MKMYNNNEGGSISYFSYHSSSLSRSFASCHS